MAISTNYASAYLELRDKFSNYGIDLPDWWSLPAELRTLFEQKPITMDRHILHTSYRMGTPIIDGLTKDTVRIMPSPQHSHLIDISIARGDTAEAAGTVLTTAEAWEMIVMLEQAIDMLDKK
ncbi:hypothetical protein V757_12245 [Pelistega indica]|uniref:Uncharacterized protein n=1 Tax=Pelistega indica TaxID=1414851 RepID=V8FSP4_9BURK|nr:hypothetical protein [Pelistega indica]ETD66723.1 hypothetical protein V757_12245 [Pelistega indica]